MNILGKLPESTSVTGKLDWIGLLKVLRLAIVVGGAAIVGAILQQLPAFNFMPESTIDEMIIQLALVPVLEGVRRTLADYSKKD